jgi:penicillin-binding protein 1C
VATVLAVALRLWPYPALDTALTAPASTRYIDRHNTLVHISSAENGIRREWTPIKALPPELVAAVVLAEDARFYTHCGVDVAAALHAIVENIAAERITRGASTITMQLARVLATRNGAPTTRTLKAKATEAINALRLETRLSKQSILELYLNEVPFGYGAAGVTSAATTFFGVEPSALTGAQVFALAVALRRPARYSPLATGGDCWPAARALARRFAADAVLRLRFPAMCALDENAWKEAEKSAQAFHYPFDAPHYIRYIASKPNAAKRGIVRLPLDLPSQRYAAGLLRETLAPYTAQRLTTGAVLALDNATGKPLVWVGSANFNDAEAGQVDGVLAREQPGSSAKPLLYALALPQRTLQPA